MEWNFPFEKYNTIHKIIFALKGKTSNKINQKDNFPPKSIPKPDATNIKSDFCHSLDVFCLFIKIKK